MMRVKLRCRVAWSSCCGKQEESADVLFQSYVDNNPLTNGSHNPNKRCHELQASTAFFWFLFATFIATLAMTALNSRGSGMGGGRGGIRRGGPSMSQV